MAIGNDTNCKSLLHFDGANGSTTITDSNAGGAAKTWGVSGNARLVSPKFGSGCSGHWGSASAVCWISTPASADYNLGANNFTIEFWFSTKLQSTFQYLVTHFDGTGGANDAFAIGMSNANNGRIGVWIYGTTNTSITSTNSYNDSNWHHLAFVRNGNVFTLYVDGVADGTTTVSTTINSCPSQLAVGGSPVNSVSGLAGFIDEFCFSNGTARYTANFSPPTSPLMSDGFTKSLLHFDGNYTDSATGGAAHTWTPQTFAMIADPKFGGSCLVTDGVSGNYVSTGSTADFAMGSGNFTIDFWFKTKYTGRQVLAEQWSNTVTSAAFLIEINNAGTGKVDGTVIVGSTGSQPISVGASYNDGNWHHYALVRNGSNLIQYLDGVQDGGVTISGSVNSAVSSVVIGGEAQSNAYWAAALCEEFRFSNVARWTANFTPPTSAYAVVAVLTANDLVTASPTFGAPTIAQKQIMGALGFTNSSPVFGAPALAVQVILTASSLTTGSPVLGTPLVSGLAALDFTTSSPTFGTPTVRAFWALVAVNLTTASPVIDNAALIGQFFATNLVTGSPVFGQPLIRQTQVLVASDLITSSPVFGSPSHKGQPPPVYPSDMDRHVRRLGGDYAKALLDLLPFGPAWTRAVGSTLVRTVTGLADYYGYVDGRAADLLERESDPRSTLELLPDWERAWGLPDECFPPTQTISQRQAMLVLKMTLLGAQSRSFFIYVAQWLGYTITISEYAPFMAGVSRVGDTRTNRPLSPEPLLGDFRWYIGPPEMRFYWTVHVGGGSLTWFRASSGRAGVDPHLRIGLADDLECLLRRWKPAHTEIIFDYSDFEHGGPMDGTP